MGFNDKDDTLKSHSPELVVEAASDAHHRGSATYDPMQESRWTRLGLSLESYKRAPGLTMYGPPSTSPSLVAWTTTTTVPSLWLGRCCPPLRPLHNTVCSRLFSTLPQLVGYARSRPR